MKTKKTHKMPKDSKGPINQHKRMAMGMSIPQGKKKKNERRH